MTKIAIIGVLNPPRLYIGQLLSKDKLGFKFSPIFTSKGPTTKWVWGPGRWFNYELGDWIMKEFGHIKGKKELKRLVKQYDYIHSL